MPRYTLLCASLLAACLLAACASTRSARTAGDVAPLIDAEKAFAAETAAHGWNAGVRAFAAPDAVVASPLPVNALASLEPSGDAGASPLEWRPAFAGIARSGDLGFTTGPYFLRGKGYVGHYFTVWRREAGGEWRWIFDGGVNVRDAAPQPPGANVTELRAATRGTDAARALATVRGIEAKLAATARTDVARALAPWLADATHLNRASQPRALGEQAALATLRSTATAMHYELIGATASGAGDLVFTQGRASWRDGTERVGSFARIWQRTRNGWRIAYDQIVPPR